MRLRKDVMVYVRDPSKKFFHVVVELKNTPGALHDLLGVLREFDLNVLASFSSVDGASKVGVWSGFVEDSHHTVSEIRKKVSSSEFVVDSVVTESKDGFLVDRLHFPLSWSTGDRAFMARATYIAKMLREIREKFGTGGEKIVYDEGYAWGRESWAEMTARMGGKFVLSNLESFLMIYQAQGWFKIERVERNERTGAVTVDASESFECMGAKSKGAYSQLVRGHLAGAFTAILGTEMVCEEKRCIAAGGRLCEFALNPRPLGARGLGATSTRS